MLKGPNRWLLALLLVSGAAAVIAAGPVIAGSSSKKTVKKVVKANGGIFNATSGQTTALSPVGSSPQSFPVAVTLSLPKGNYAITAKISANNVPGNSVVSCFLMLSGVTVMDNSFLQPGASAGGSNGASLPLQAAANLRARSNVDVRCIGPSGSSVTDPRVQAVRGPTLSGKDNSLPGS